MRSPLDTVVVAKYAIMAVAVVVWLLHGIVILFFVIAARRRDS
jgi:uncharacterized protein with PQ loop repeat